MAEQSLAENASYQKLLELIENQQNEQTSLKEPALSEPQPEQDPKIDPLIPLLISSRMRLFPDGKGPDFFPVSISIKEGEELPETLAHLKENINETSSVFGVPVTLEQLIALAENPNIEFVKVPKAAIL